MAELNPSTATPAASEPLKILVVRPDRLGDVILSTPVFEVIKRHYPRSHLTVMVREAVAPVIRGLPSVDSVMIYDPDGRHRGLRGFQRLCADVEKGAFRIAVVLQSPWKIAAAIFIAGVRYRVGPLSKPHSFLYYNRGVRQRRSQVEMHETDYNLHLLRRLGIRASARSVPVRAHVPDDTRRQARAWLEARGWRDGDKLVAVHPGMGGSALNWPEHHYLDLIRALLKDKRKVLVTGGPTEGPLLDRISRDLGFGGLDGGGTPAGAGAGLTASGAPTPIFYGGTQSGTVDLLAGLFMHADVVVAPSTGPLHLAVSVGRPVATFYPPIRVQSAIRWGPYVADEDRAGVMVPEVYCGEDFSCRGSLCNYFPCMKTITVNEALGHVNRQLAKASPPTSPAATSTEKN